MWLFLRQFGEIRKTLESSRRHPEMREMRLQRSFAQTMARAHQDAGTCTDAHVRGDDIVHLRRGDGETTARARTILPPREVEKLQMFKMRLCGGDRFRTETARRGT